MGQKVNPVGLRLGVNRGWDSVWYAKKKDFGKFLIEDFKIREYIKKNVLNSGVSKVMIERTTKKCFVTIYTSRPGFVIGKKGSDIEKIKGNLSKLTTNAEPLKYDSSGMLFYEDSTGFRFRSLENMLAISGVARPVVAKFQQKPRNVKGGTGVTDIISEMQTVDGYSIVNQFDTLKNLSNGVYASKTVTHDNFNKTFSEQDFDYNIYFPTIFHTEHDGSGGKVDNKGQLPLFNYKDGKMISDKPEGSLNFVSTTEKLQNDYEGPEGERTLPRNDAQKFSFKSQSISLDCKGFTGLSVGDLVSFEVPSYEPPGMDNPLDIDPYMSGRYLVYKIHHRISSNADVHTMNLECVKDAVRVAYPEENIDTFSSRENNDSLTYLQYELDELILKDKGEEV